MRQRKRCVPRCAGGIQRAVPHIHAMGITSAANNLSAMRRLYDHRKSGAPSMLYALVRDPWPCRKLAIPSAQRSSTKYPQRDRIPSHGRSTPPCGGGAAALLRARARRLLWGARLRGRAVTTTARKLT